MKKKEQLKIYEERFCIFNGCINSLLADNISQRLIPIGWLEAAYHRAVSENYIKGIKKLRVELKKCGYTVKGN